MDVHIAYLISKNKRVEYQRIRCWEIVGGKENDFFSVPSLYRGIEQLHGTRAFSPRQVETWLGCGGGGGVGAARHGSSWFVVPPLTKKKK
jgi:hypothetical protein